MADPTIPLQQTDKSQQFRTLNKDLNALKGRPLVDATLQMLTLFPEIDNPQSREYLAKACGWAVYYALRDGDIRHDIKMRKTLLARYLQIPVERPSKLHSMILVEAVRTAKYSSEMHPDRWVPFNFLKFFRLWGVANLRPGDWKIVKNEQGISLKSLVEKSLLLCLKDAMKSEETLDAEIVDLVNQTVALRPSNTDMTRLLAMVNAKRGNKERALDEYVRIALTSSAKFYIWSEMANLIDDRDMRMAFLCKSISVADSQDFLCKVRLSLALELLEAGHPSRAMLECCVAEEIYKKRNAPNHWNLRRVKQQIGTDVVPVPDNSDLYLRGAAKADDYIWSRLDVLDNIDHAKVVAGPIRHRKNKAGKSFGSLGGLTANWSLMKGIPDGAEVRGVAVLEGDKWKLRAIRRK